VPILVSTVHDGDRNTSTVFTCVSAGPLPAARATRIHCAKRDLVRKLSKHLGIGELPTGHVEFDDVVHVSGAPRALVLEYLDGPTRHLVAESDTGFDVEHGELVVRREGIPTEPERLIAMTRFAERLVRRWCAFARGPARLATSLGFTAQASCALGDGAGLVASGIHRSRATRHLLRLVGDLVLTVLSFHHPGGAEWTLERDENDAFTVSGAPPEGVLAFANRAPSSLLGVRAIDAAIELAFAGTAPDEVEVAAALDAVVDALPSLAPYR
jgi:hypothetical protein